MNKIDEFCQYHSITIEKALSFINSKWTKVRRTEEDLFCSCGKPNRISHNR